MTKNKEINEEDFVIHYDLSNNIHQIPIEQSIQCEEMVKVIAQDINLNIFRGELDYQIFVFAEEEGGIIKKFIIRGIAMLSFVGFMNSDILNGVLLGTVGKESKDIVKDVTIFLKKEIINFISKDNYYLTNCGYDISNYHRSYKQKNKFFQHAIANEIVQGIGFACSHNFPIKRKEFSSRILDVEGVLGEIPPTDKYHNLIVVSQINSKDDKNLAWTVKDREIKKNFSVYLRDDYFNDILFSKYIRVDSMICRVRYHYSYDEFCNIQVIKKTIEKVYKYNDTILFELPNDAQITPAPFNTDNTSEIFIRNVNKESSGKILKNSNKNSEDQLSLNI